MNTSTTTSTTKKLRWGILGTGNIAGQFAAGVRASSRGELAAVGSRTAEAAGQFAAKYGISVAVGSYQALIDAPSVDAIYVSLPNTLHHPWTIAALRSGKHVLCEKPLGATAAEAEEMFDVAAASGRVMVEAFMYRSHPQTLAIIDAVKNGDIGELKMIRASFVFRTTKIDGNIRFSSELAGGSLMDVGCYCINFSRLFARCEPSAVHAVARLHSSGVDEFAAGTMTFPNGILASFVSGMTVQADNTAYLCGSEGYIEIPVPWKPPGGGTASNPVMAEYVVGHSVPPRMDVGNMGVAKPPREVRRVAVEGELYGIEADDFAATVLDGRAARVSRQDTVGNMRVLDEMRRQAGVAMRGVNG